ncbi:hypothetical protein RvY_15834 [Ramazzottius varieornatus]|uniref:Uncharacterized protein n=1 Tax=Ramazzottius varieornatus TaxID=947166 RepID=A0A1D1W311_RAMVA|nr:hypothetical protein RvY_15834 [Ramazzottius varieornatus]
MVLESFSIDISNEQQRDVTKILTSLYGTLSTESIRLEPRPCSSGLRLSRYGNSATAAGSQIQEVRKNESYDKECDGVVGEDSSN